MNVGDLATPALVLDQARFEQNLAAMAAALRERACART